MTGGAANWVTFLCRVAHDLGLSPRQTEFFIETFKPHDPTNPGAVVSPWQPEDVDQGNYRKRMEETYQKLWKYMFDDELKEKLRQCSNTNDRTKVVVLPLLTREYAHPQHFEWKDLEDDRKRLEFFLRQLNYHDQEDDFIKQIRGQKLAKAFLVEVDGKISRQWLLHRLLYKIQNHSIAKPIKITANPCWDNDNTPNALYQSLFDQLDDSVNDELSLLDELCAYCEKAPLIIIVYDLDCLRKSSTIDKLQLFWEKLVTQLGNMGTEDHHNCFMLLVREPEESALEIKFPCLQLSYQPVTFGHVNSWLDCIDTQALLKKCSSLTLVESKQELDLLERSPPDAFGKNIEKTLEVICKAFRISSATELQKYWTIL
jgi:hypothetical protein